MACLNPITIPNPSTRFKEYHNDTIVVPCGKCINCLKRKQSDLAVRLAAEAEKRGSFQFVTLTYRDEDIPLTSTLFCVDTDTGELERLSEPQFVASSRTDDYLFLRSKFSQIASSSKPRYLDFDIEEFSAFDSGKRYFYRVTPSVCREDVRLWLKRSRVRYERAFGSSLPQFSYCCVPEYGPRTCRPHYHLAFFGLSEKDCTWLCEQWQFGFYCLDNVKVKNKDGSSGYAAAARYIGKYMSKGVFECESVFDCCAEKPRVCSSKNLGDNLLSKLQPYVMCYDLFGSYDADTLIRSNGDKLTRLQLDTLCNEIPKRLCLSVDGRYYYALPRVFRQKLFYVKETFGVENIVAYRSSALWQMVSNRIRSEFEMLRRREFEEFFSANISRSPADIVASFASIQKSSIEIKESFGRKTLQQFYAKSSV